MRKIALALGLLLLPALAYAQITRLDYYQAGFRLINGSQLNKMVDVVNKLSGNGSSTNNIGIICPTYYFTGTPAATDQAFFVAPYAMTVKSATEVHSVAAGGASVLQLTKETTTGAPGSGTDLLSNNSSTGFDLNGTANTVQVGTFVATAGVLNLIAGDRLSIDYANSIQSTAGVVLTVCLAPL